MRIPFIGKEINPGAAFNRYGKAVNQGMNNPEALNPMYGNADKAFYWLGQQPGIGKVLDYGFQNPAIGGGSLIAGTLVNNLIGNPVGGAIDFISMDATNLKPDEYVEQPPQIITLEQQPTSQPITTTPNAVLASQPGMEGLQSNQVEGLQSNQIEIPQLTEEERARFLKTTTNRTAQQILTYQALQDFLNQQPQSEGY